MDRAVSRARRGRAVFVHFLRNAAGPVGRGFERRFFRSLSPEGEEGAVSRARKGRAVFVYFLRNAAGPVARGFKRRFFRPLRMGAEKAQQDAHARGGRRGTPLEARMQRTGCARRDRPAVRAGWKTPAAGKAVSRRRRRRLRCRARRAPPFFRCPAACWPARGKGGAALPSRRAGSAPGNLFVQAGRFASAVGEGEFVRARRRCSTPARKTAGSNPEIVCAQGRCPFARLRQGDAAPVRAIKTSHLRARGGKKTPRDGADV